MNIEIVRCAAYEGINPIFGGLFGNPKFTIQCGKCKLTFQQKIPLVNPVMARCTLCGTINSLPLEVS